jgi:hypothetical protein
MPSMQMRSTTWPELATELLEKLTGRGAEITCEFVNLEVHAPGAAGAGSPPARWRLNGTLKIRARENLQG